MKFTCLKSNLLQALKVVGTAVDRRSYLPILQNIHFEAKEGGQLSLSATDLEVRIDHRLAVQVEQPGATTMPARLLTDFIGTLPDEQIGFAHLDEINMRVVCDKHKATIQCAMASEFPAPPVFENDNFVVEVPSDLFKIMLQRVLISTAPNDSSRPVLGGVLFEFTDDNTLVMASADGFRLTSCRIALDKKPLKTAESVIVPAGKLAGLERFSGDEPIQIFLFNRERIAFRSQDTDATFQLIEGRFPNYDAIIPKTHTTLTTVDAGELTNVCKTAKMFARLEMGIVGLSIESGYVAVSAMAVEMGDVLATIDAQVNGDAIDLAFSVGYLLDALAVMRSDKVVIQSTTETAAVVIKPPQEENFVHVLMPMRKLTTGP